MTCGWLSWRMYAAQNVFCFRLKTTQIYTFFLTGFPLRIFAHTTHTYNIYTSSTAMTFTRPTENIIYLDVCILDVVMMRTHIHCYINVLKLYFSVFQKDKLVRSDYRERTLRNMLIYMWIVCNKPSKNYINTGKILYPV